MAEKIIKVLLADDTLIAREGWRAILETNEDIIVVGESTTAHETPRKVDEHHPDVLLIDLKWFGDDTAGTTTIRDLKSLYPKLKIIAITAYENLIHEARLAGADAALTKTFSREDLLMVIRELVTRARDNHINPSLDTPLSELTSREREVLELVAKGHSDREISSKLGIARTTAKNHMKSIIEKLGAKNRTEAASIAREMGLFR